jgi:hypothetical protein
MHAYQDAENAIYMKGCSGVFPLQDIRFDPEAKVIVSNDKILVSSESEGCVFREEFKHGPSASACCGCARVMI